MVDSGLYGAVLAEVVVHTGSIRFWGRSWPARISPDGHADAAVLHRQTARSPAWSSSVSWSGCGSCMASATPGTPSGRAAIAPSRSCSAFCRQFVLHPRYAALTDAISIIQWRRSFMGVFRPRAHIWPVYRQSVASDSSFDSSLRASDLLADNPHFALGRSESVK